MIRGLVVVNGACVWFQAYKVGEHILARWTDCKMYPAKVIAINENGAHVTFADNSS